MSTADRIVVVEGVRTPFVRARTVFDSMPAASLGGVALRETVARSGIDPALIEEVYYGIVSAPADGPNVSREALFDSGLPSEIPCTTLNRYCASAIEAVAGAMGKISSGQIDIALAGGVESLSNVRAVFSKAATDHFQKAARLKSFGQTLGWLSQFKLSYFKPLAPGISEPTTGLTMGQSADLMARLFEISREDQDAYAAESHHKAAAAWDNGFYQNHVVPVATPKGVVIDRDTDIRSDTSPEKLARLKPVFYKDGTITAGNASPLTDGASALLLMKESKAKELGLQPLGTIRAIANAAVDIKKEPLLIGPVYAIPRLLKMAGVEWSNIDLIEMHEAFAGQVLSTIKALESDSFAKDKLGLDRAIGTVDRSILNVNGGSIPLGHPFGATGGRVILQALHELRNRRKSLGLISVCAAGGMGAVALVEAL